MSFQLDANIERDSRHIIDLTLCEVRLQNEDRFPWIVLIPRKPDIVELIDLEMEDLHQLTEEIAFASHAMRTLFGPDKLNVGSLGNSVRQLHIHIIARHEKDLAWPNPVWGYFEYSREYSSDTLRRRIEQLKRALTA